MKTSSSLFFALVFGFTLLVGCSGPDGTETAQSGDQAVTSDNPNPTDDEFAVKYCGTGIPHLPIDTDVMLNPLVIASTTDPGVVAVPVEDPFGRHALYFRGTPRGGHVSLMIRGRRSAEPSVTVDVETAAGETVTTLVTELHFAIRAETGINASFSPEPNGAAQLVAGGIDAPGVCSTGDNGGK
jgi:hypothetical protein